MKGFIGSVNFKSIDSASSMKRFLLPEHAPQIDASAFVAAAAVVVGSVKIGAQASVWFGSVLRGDINHIEIGAGSNVQDGTIVHVSDDFGVVVGERVSIGHRAVIHACTVGDETLVGMGAIIMDGAVIGKRCVVAAGSLVTKGLVVPDGSLVMGSPARVVRALSEEEQESNVALAAKYVESSGRFKDLGFGI
jgi:carbonic anhydrase/acetyltransferase-like protein (isoleucine patch superfamily)